MKLLTIILLSFMLGGCINIHCDGHTSQKYDRSTNFNAPVSPPMSIEKQNVLALVGCYIFGLVLCIILFHDIRESQIGVFYASLGTFVVITFFMWLGVLNDNQGLNPLTFSVTTGSSVVVCFRFFLSGI